ncbi:EAL domain-containing protein [Legionella rowbothamii]|uniref:EAL domain-containing protein n=1 Tax=Legionella rowbothamii TaxID=96229 RepID=UPI001F5ED416|nr:EAL domain-containing protein [Legionella rowbothamii]
MWQNHIAKAYIQVSKAAHVSAYNLDSLINEAFYLLQTLPILKKAKLDCKEDLLPYLDYINIAHPKILAISIKDTDHNLFCSTLSYSNSFLINEDTPSPTIVGPLERPTYNFPIYSLRKNIGHYKIELIFMASMLEDLLKPNGQDNYTIILYNQNNKESLLKISKKPKTSLMDHTMAPPRFPLIVKPIVASVNLQNIKGVSVKLIYSPQILFSNLRNSQILLTLDILILSAFSYYLLKNLIHVRTSLLWSIRKAIKRRLFYPVYQPIFNVKLNQYSSVEVLVRWRTKHDEVIMPDSFIIEAEEARLIVPITLQIVEITFKETQDILKSSPLFHLSINICAAHFIDSDFFDKFYQLQQDYSIASTQILLEITERNLLDEHNDIYLQKMQELRNKGFSLAIDDYGTGHASLSYLQHFPFSYLKIDKIYIQAIGSKAITELLNDAIIDLAKKLNLIIIAEGVETKEQVNYLLKNEVQLLQGWYFSKALSIEQLKKLLQGEKK